MNWHQFHLFLFEQLNSFRIADSTKNYQAQELLADSVVINYAMDRSTSGYPDLSLDSSSSRKINVGGAGIMYRNHFLRTLKDIPIRMGITGYAGGVAKFTSRTFYQSFRSIPLALAIGGMYNNLVLFHMYATDLSSGQYPGTDENIFIQ